MLQSPCLHSAPPASTVPIVLQAQDFAEVFTGANPQALDLMKRMLKFNPADRISVEAALAHPYLATLHDASAEPRCPRVIHLGFEDDNLDGDQCRERMFKEIVTYYRR